MDDHQGVGGGVVGIEHADIGWGVAQGVAEPCRMCPAEVVSPAQRTSQAEIMVGIVSGFDADKLRSGRNHVHEFAHFAAEHCIQVFVPSVVAERGRVAAYLPYAVCQVAGFAADVETVAVPLVGVVDVQRSGVSRIIEFVEVVVSPVRIIFVPVSSVLVSVVVVSQCALQRPACPEQVFVVKRAGQDI